jgi:hypothetical protein
LQMLFNSSASGIPTKTDRCISFSAILKNWILSAARSRARAGWRRSCRLERRSVICCVAFDLVRIVNGAQASLRAP